MPCAGQPTCARASVLGLTGWSRVPAAAAMVREPPSDAPDEAVGPSAVSPYCVDFNKIPALEPYELVC